MLDGLLGRGFSAKCKSLMKQAKSRIEVIRRKRNATLKFLKKDMADLLANGLDINAFGRAEGLLAELMLSACYDFVEQSCDFVLKHLSVMENMRHCPEDCREAVSSLMFAAARFSDLPELRDLRQIFYERYGSSLELFANKEFVENLSSKPFTTEKKVQLMQDIASEFTIRWDSKAYQQRMSKPSVSAQDQPKTYGSFHTNDDKYKSINGTNSAAKKERDDALLKQKYTNTGYRLPNDKESNTSRRNDFNSQLNRDGFSNGYDSLNAFEENTMRRANSEITFQGPQEGTLQKHDVLKEGASLKTIKSGGSSQRKRIENVNPEFKLHDGRDNNLPKGDGQIHRKPDVVPSYGRSWSQGDGKHVLAGGTYGSCQDIPTSRKDFEEEEAHKLRHRYNGVLPPPYTKPNSKARDGKYGANSGSSHAFADGNMVPKDLLRHNSENASNRPDKMHQDIHHANHERQSVGPAGHEHEISNSYPDDCSSSINPLPKPRSSRRTHSKSLSSYDDAGKMEDAGAVKRRSRSRRKDDSRRGLEVLFDNEHHHNDEEERMIDKLLVHYSKKPSTHEPGKTRRSSKSRHAHSQGSEADKFPLHVGRDGPDEISEMFPHPPRSVSLPHEQATQSEARKVFTRAATFQADGSCPARHVHPKLPDYDDLAARFAALKRS